ncbi:MAG: ribonuclease P protein component [Alphaproteobacteria bacterium]|nr:ribonuclease P protein component [Alphaproteobacteria bacterium]MCB1839888.1 ribonuclease P protein component [Alphaproteobacteria bacterium]
MHATKEQLKSLKILKKRADFLKMRNGRKWVSHGLILQVCDNELGIKRIGFTVSKKVHKSAVRRNRIKRRLRAVAADILPLCARDGVDYVLIGREQTATRPYQLLQNDLKWCLKKTGYLQQE